jgi:hypothetical protein
MSSGGGAQPLTLHLTIHDAGGVWQARLIDSTSKKVIKADGAGATPLAAYSAVFDTSERSRARSNRCGRWSRSPPRRHGDTQPTAAASIGGPARGRAVPDSRKYRLGGRASADRGLLA